jgi:outer membrane protein TolC
LKDLSDREKYRTTNTRAAVIGILVLAAIASAQSASVLTIDDAVALALKGNRDVQAAALDVDRAREGTAALKSKRLPQFQIYALGGIPLTRATATVPQGALGTYPAAGPIPGPNVSVTTARQLSGVLVGQALQPGSQLWKIHLDLISSHIREDLAQQRLRQKRQETAQSVRQIYDQIAQTRAQIESAEAEEKTLVELQAETDRKLVELAVLKSDTLDVRARLSRQRYQLVKLRDWSKTQKESFNRLLGRDLEVEFSVELEPLPAAEEIELAAAQRLALRQRPEIQEARLQTKKAEAEVRREHAEYIPDISAGVTYAAFPNVSFLPQNFAIAGFALQWQPFDWGEKRHKIRSLGAAVQQAALSERDSEQQILLDVNSKSRALAEARMLLDTVVLVQQAQRESLRETMNRYREKATLLSDALQQQGAMVQADSDYQNALAAFWKAKADFDRALGREY